MKESGRQIYLYIARRIDIERYGKKDRESERRKKIS